MNAATDGVARRIGDCTVVLRSELPGLLGDFARLYGEASSDGDGMNRIDMEVRRVAGRRFARRHYQVYGDGETVGGPRPKDQVFPFLEWGINLRVIARLNGYLQLHAASLSYGGRGVIFAGPSGCGKSTLAAGLLARGWGYYCDEFALVSPKSLFLHAFPKALCIKAGSFGPARELGLRFSRRGDYIKGQKGRVAYIAPGEFGSDVTACPSRARVIVFPTYGADRRPQLVPMSRGRAMFELAKCLFNRHRFGDAAYDVLAELVRGAEAFELRAGELGATCELVESHLTGCAAPAGTLRAPGRITVPTARPRRTGRSQQAAVGTRLEPAVRAGGDAGEPVLAGRRELLRLGAKFAYVAPAVLTLSATEVFAQASNPSGICSTAANTGEMCETNDDCCSNRCTLMTCD